MQMAHCTLLHSANQMQVVLALGQSGVSNLALVGKKKNALSLNQGIYKWQRNTANLYVVVKMVK